ncbi:hypothetical protein BV20DRAFT_1058345, partial [Pilatotrama ljubarskyi]
MAPTAPTAPFASPTFVSPVYPTRTGAAANLRKHLQHERDEQDDDLPSDQEGAARITRHCGRDIVIEDRSDHRPMTALSYGYCEGVVGNFCSDAVSFHGRLKKLFLTKRHSAVSPVSRLSSSQSAFTTTARHNPSPAILTSTSSATRAFHQPRLLATSASMSSGPITLADPAPDDAEIAPRTPDSTIPPSPIHLGEIAEQLLAMDSPVDARFDSFDNSTLRFPPEDAESSMLSDGGVGIGLSLLQDFAGGDDDGDADDHEDDEERTSIQRTQSPESTVEGPLETPRSDSHYSQSPRSIAQPPPSAHSDFSDCFSQLPPSARSQSLYSDSPSSNAAPLPSAHSGSDYGGDDWEGADDIYDDYRYSRYSMASKMSRFSKGSMHTLASTSQVVPPIPTEHARPSIDSVQREGPAARERKGSAPSKLH